LISITRAVFPQFDHYAAESPMIEPMWVNLTSANYLQISLYQLWEAAFYGSLLVAARIFTVRVERTRYLLYQSAMARRRSESSLDTARLQALQTQIDPSLLLDSMQELEQRYRASPERAERLLEALVEFLRYAMHGLRVPDSTLGAELQLARAFSHLQHERGIESAWHVVEEPPSQGVSLKFPSLLMLPLMALGGSGGRPLLRVRVQSGQVVLSLHGLSRGVSVELRQQIQARLYAMYGDRFHFEFQPSTPSQLRITLQSTHRPSGEVYA
jgi:signal transduction histidine kinase